MSDHITSNVRISVIIPVYNQQTIISYSLARIKEVLDLFSKSYELIVINDGSYDTTLNILREEQMLDPRMRVITYIPNRGKGYAIKSGIMQSSGDVLLFIDADLDISPSAIMHYIKQIEKFDLVVASKRHHLSKVHATISRKIQSRMFSTLVRIAVGIKIKDTQSGLKAGKGDLLRRIFKIMVVERYAFDVELLVIASLLNLNIKELPVELRLDNRFRILDILKMLRDVAVICYRYRISRFYKKQLKQEITI